jgi:hypothetical protein
VDHCSEEDVEAKQLPSWAARWDKYSGQYIFAFPDYWYNAGGVKQKFAVTIQDDKTLLLPAVKFDTVAWTSDLITKDNISLTPKTWDLNLVNAQTPFIDFLWDQVHNYIKILSPASFPHGIQILKDAFTLALVPSYPAEPIEHLDLEIHRQRYSSYLQAVRQAIKPDHSAKALGDPYRFWRSVITARNRRFGITKSGRVCLLPQFTRPGDVCCVCPGMKYPIILRATENFSYHLVGHGYMHKSTNGEIMQELSENKVELRELKII